MKAAPSLQSPPLQSPPLPYLADLIANLFGYPPAAVSAQTRIDALAAKNYVAEQLAAECEQFFGLPLPLGIEADWRTLADVLAALDAARAASRFTPMQEAA